MQCRPACPPFIVCYDIPAFIVLAKSFPLIHLLRPSSSFPSLLMKTQYEVDVLPASFRSSRMRPANALLYMTSRPPCWCFKTIKRRPLWTFFLCRNFLLFRKIGLAAVHGRENALLALFFFACIWTSLFFSVQSATSTVNRTWNITW